MRFRMKGDKFSCKNCNYKWANKREVEPTVCPGCNSSLINNESEVGKQILADEDIDVIDWEDDRE